MLTRQRCTTVALVATLLAATAVRLLAACWSPTDVVVDLCLVALAAATCWAWLAILAVVVEVWRGAASSRRTLLRRVVLVLCGVALATPAHAAVADDRAPSPASIAGLPYPDRAVGPAHRTVVVVRAGDSLWRLAAADLPPSADPARITARWRAIHRLNRTTIGADPDLIHPGQRLVLPR